MSSALAVVWLLGALFGDLFDGLFNGSDWNCRFAEEQSERTMRRIGEQWPLRSIEDPVSEYVQSLGLRLARVVDQKQRQPWDFYVLRDAEPSAIAVGGGHFVISDGLVAFARNESELAAVLAHEISHQVLGHFCRGTSPAVERIDRGTVVQHYELDAEMDADREAIRLLAAAGFDPGAMESVLRCLQPQPRNDVSHLGKRIHALASRWIERSEHRIASSAAFVTAQSAAIQDLGDSAQRYCR